MPTKEKKQWPISIARCRARQLHATQPRDTAQTHDASQGSSSCFCCYFCCSCLSPTHHTSSPWPEHTRSHTPTYLFPTTVHNSEGLVTITALMLSASSSRPNAAIAAITKRRTIAHVHSFRWQPVLISTAATGSRCPTQHEYAWSLPLSSRSSSSLLWSKTSVGGTMRDDTILNWLEARTRTAGG